MKNNQFAKLFFATSLLVISLLAGTLGYKWIEGYNMLDAFYMSVITFSTVGFGEVEELSEDGRLFTAVYILLNLGVLTYAVSVVANYFFEGKLRLIFKNYLVDREINKLTNHIIICGYGITGKEAADELIKNKRPFVIIEKEPTIVDKFVNKAGFYCIQGDAIEDATLKIAGIERASSIIITTPSDADNVFITLTAKEFKPNIKIYARASANATEKKLFRAGADQVINSARQGGTYMAQMITNPVVIEFLNLLTGESLQHYQMEAIRYENLKPKYKDKTLRDLNIHEATGCTVVGVKDDIKGLIPSPTPDTFIGPDDTIIVLGNETQLAKMWDQFTQ
ncbi:MAG: NAD-binding protein [Bacteroidota bacterium]